MTTPLAPRFRFAPLLAGLLLLPAPAAAQGGVEALDAAARRFATVTSLCADFHQELRIELLRQTKTSEGRLCQRRPNHFRMTYSDPAGDEIVADGTWFWLHLPSENPGQVIRIPMSSQPGGYDFYREFLENPIAKYEVTDAGSEVVDGTQTRVVDLVPREPKDWRSATLWIDPEARMIRQLEIRENSGTVRRVLLTGIETSPSLPADHFDFRVPTGTTVIDMGGGPVR